MRSKCNLACKLIVTAALYILAVVAVIYAGVLEFPVWLVFMVGLIPASVWFTLYGASFYILLTGIFGLLVYYYGLGNIVELDPEEIVFNLYSFLFFLVNMLVMGITLSYLIEKSKMEKENIKEHTLTDQLTGLRNYGYFINRLYEERVRSDKEDRDLSLIMIDIDLFKDFNDRFGHQAGNEVLKKVARIIESNVRASDIVCRYGGEEFAVILPGTPLQQAVEIAERIRESVEKEYFYGNRVFPRIRKTISCGVASYPSQAQDELELIDFADRALYYAKNTGRNKTVAYDEEVESRWFKGLAEELI
jgi:diguanylate cyclase (GGDEF)-like protein